MTAKGVYLYSCTPIYARYISKNLAGLNRLHLLFYVKLTKYIVSNYLLLVAGNSPSHVCMNPTIVFIQDLLTLFGHRGRVSVRPPLQIYELSCCLLEWSVEIET